MAGTATAGALPPATVDVAPACDVLAGWDGRYDVDSEGAGAVARVHRRSTTGDVGVGRAVRPGPAGGHTVRAGGRPGDGPDPVLVNLGRAVQILGVAGVPLDAELGSVQIDGRVPDQRLPVPGGLGVDGVTNVVSYGQGSSSTSEELPARPTLVAPRSELAVDGTYRITYGTSFLLAVEFTDDGPQASSILTYGETGDRRSPLFTSQVKRFAAKDWKPVRFTEQDIVDDPAYQVEQVSG